jgi:hypothetical protein
MLRNFKSICDVAGIEVNLDELDGLLGTFPTSGKSTTSSSEPKSEKPEASVPLVPRPHYADSDVKQLVRKEKDRVAFGGILRMLDSTEVPSSIVKPLLDIFEQSRGTTKNFDKMESDVKSMEELIKPTYFSEYFSEPQLTALSGLLQAMKKEVKGISMEVAGSQLREHIDNWLLIVNDALRKMKPRRRGIGSIINKTNASIAVLLALTIAGATLYFKQQRKKDADPENPPAQVTPDPNQTIQHTNNATQPTKPADPPKPADDKTVGTDPMKVDEPKPMDSKPAEPVKPPPDPDAEAKKAAEKLNPRIEDGFLTFSEATAEDADSGKGYRLGMKRVFAYVHFDDGKWKGIDTGPEGYADKYTIEKLPGHVAGAKKLHVMLTVTGADGKVQKHTTTLSLEKK